MSEEQAPGDTPSPRRLLFMQFSRGVAEIQWLLIILVILYLVTTGDLLQTSPEIMLTIAAYFVFSLSGNYASFFNVNRAVLLTVHTLVMMAFITAILHLADGLGGPLVSLYLVVIVTSALALGKVATLLEVAAVAACYLWLTQHSDTAATVPGLAMIAANVVIFVVVGYLTTTLVEAIHTANEHLKQIPRLERGIESTLQRWRYMVEQSNDAFVEVDSAGLVTEWNPRATDLFGWQREEAIGADIRELIVPPESRAEPFTNLQQFFSGESDDVSDRRVKATALRRDGTRFPVEMLIHDFHMPEQRYFNAFLHDISEREREHNQLAHKAHIDAVTGLANRHVFNERLTRVLERAHPRTRSLLLLIDLDNLKTVNDRHGHAVGDSVLRQVAGRIQQTARERDLVARLGGDEFVILMEQLKPLEQDTLDQIADKVVRAVDHQYRVGDVEIRLTASVGLAVYPGTADTPDGLVKQADIAMYAAKQAGNNRYRIDPSAAAARAGVDHASA